MMEAKVADSRDKKKKRKMKKWHKIKMMSRTKVLIKKMLDFLMMLPNIISLELFHKLH